VSEEIRKYTYLANGKENEAEIEGSGNCASGLRADIKNMSRNSIFFFLDLQFSGEIGVIFGSSVAVRGKG
jgi:hypothetical protein